MPRVTCLSRIPGAHFFLFEWGDVTFVFDCGLPELPDRPDEDAKTRASHSIPSLWADLNLVDWGSVDFILISNHTQMLALPFIMGYSAFAGAVYFTEVGLVFARCWIEELVQYQETPRVSRPAVGPSSSTAVSSTSTARSGAVGGDLRHLPYTHSDALQCLEKIMSLRYKETQCPFHHVKVTPYSSGFALGSANWVVEVAAQRLTLLSNSSLLTATHPSNFDWTVVERTHAMFVADRYVERGPGPPLSHTLNQVNSAVLATLKQKGNVLFPCHILGLVFDLIESLAYALDAHGLSKVRMYAVSPVADRALLYANIMGEWMCPEKQNLIYLPEAPLLQDELIASGRLTYVTSLTQLTKLSYQEPCIIFAGHASLATGPARELLRQWGGNPLHAIVSIETGTDVFRSWQSLYSAHEVATPAPRCQLFNLPLDTELSTRDLLDVVERTTATAVILPSETLATLRSRLPPAGDSRTYVAYAPLEAATWEASGPQRQTVYLSENVAWQSELTLQGGQTVARIQGILREERGGLRIKPPGMFTQRGQPHKRMLCGNVATDRLIEGIKTDTGLQLDSVDKKEDGVVRLTLTAGPHKATITCDAGRTQLHCDHEELRCHLSNLIRHSSLVEL
ncbi:hypothetical protein IWQ60_007082 [Tieghemiomyces parasiticus]|uniref:Beta-Casp domain-containing protein n=1 Tax=Tieghemiomyces parasiticus TaxID=78921 RepID=A0A9W8A4J1_9FUNG|nr:hypothetical protein IWQ60_007082 [Tieghemiomyces parasiticus]